MMPTYANYTIEDRQHSNWQGPWRIFSSTVCETNTRPTWHGISRPQTCLQMTWGFGKPLRPYHEYGIQMNDKQLAASEMFWAGHVITAAHKWQHTIIELYNFPTTSTTSTTSSQLQRIQMDQHLKLGQFCPPVGRKLPRKGASVTHPTLKQKALVKIEHLNKKIKTHTSTNKAKTVISWNKSCSTHLCTKIKPNLLWQKWLARDDAMQADHFSNHNLIHSSLAPNMAAPAIRTFAAACRSTVVNLGSVLLLRLSSPTNQVLNSPTLVP